MKHVKRFLALSLAAALLAGCVSCGNSDEKTSPTGGGSGVDSTGDGGTLRIAMTCAALPNTDSEPTEGQEGYRFVSFQLYDALVKWDASSETEAGKIIPGLATSWEQNPENPKRWTFHLREGVKFHDGTDFNADCVIFALDRVMNPDFEYTSGDYTFSSLIQHLILPAIAAGAMTLGIMTRMVRSSVSEMRSRSFVTTLRAKGLSEPAIMRHVLRNSFPTLLTVAGLQFGYLMGGSTMVETIFSWPGIGLIIYQSIFTSDFPVTQAAILIVAAIFVSINLLIDLLRIVADPRLRK